MFQHLPAANLILVGLVAVLISVALVGHAVSSPEHQSPPQATAPVAEDAQTTPLK